MTPHFALVLFLRTRRPWYPSFCHRSKKSTRFPDCNKISRLINNVHSMRDHADTALMTGKIGVCSEFGSQGMNVFFNQNQWSRFPRPPRQIAYRLIPVPHPGELSQLISDCSEYTDARATLARIREGGRLYHKSHLDRDRDRDLHLREVEDAR